MDSDQQQQQMTTPLQQLVKIIISINNSYQVDSLNTIPVAIQSLDDLIFQNPKQVAQNIDKCIEILSFAIANPASCQLLQKAHILDFIVVIIERYPKLAKSKNIRGAKIYQMALDILCQVSAQIKQQWMNPPDGFNTQQQQDEDSQTVNQLMHTVDRLAIAIGFNNSVAMLQPLFIQYMQNSQDWRYPYSALTVASQIAVQGAKVQPLSKIMQYALSFTDHSHPKVRYAALQLIGQYSQDLQNEFQQAYYSSLIPITVKLLKDPIPRVVAHTFSCMANFFEKCKQLWKLQNVLGQYLNPIIHYIKTGSTLVKESALSTLSSIGQIQDSFGPNLPSIFELVAEIMKGCFGKSQYKQVLNQTFELASILLSYQKRQLVEPYLNQYVTLLYSQKDSIDKVYFIQSWNNLCSVYQQFADLAQIYPILLQTVKNAYKDLEDEDQCAKGLKCLKNTLKSFKIKALAFSAQTEQFAKEIFSNSNNAKLQQESILLMVATHTETKPIDPQSLDKWVKQAQQCYNYLIDLIQIKLECPDNQTQPLKYCYDAVLQLVISFGSCLSGNEIFAIASKQFNICRVIREVYSNFDILDCEQEGSEEIDSKHQGFQMNKTFLSVLEDTLQKAADVIEELLKFNVDVENKLKMLFLYRTQAQFYIDKKREFAMFAVSILVNILSFYSYAQIKEQYHVIMEALSNFLQNPIPRIRNATVYGFKVIFTKIDPNSFTSQQVSKLLEFLSKSFTAEFENSQDSDHQFYIQHCKDNVISALGCLLKYFGPTFPLILNQQIYKFWLNHLPLNTDKTEGNEQQQFLIEILANSPQLIVNEAKDLLTICQIYAKFVMKRASKKFKDVVSKTKFSLLMIKQWNLFKSSYNYLWESLNDGHKKTLVRLMAS